MRIQRVAALHFKRPMRIGSDRWLNALHFGVDFISALFHLYFILRMMLHWPWHRWP